MSAVVTSFLYLALLAALLIAGPVLNERIATRRERHHEASREAASRGGATADSAGVRASVVSPSLEFDPFAVSEAFRAELEAHTVQAQARVTALHTGLLVPIPEQRDGRDS